MVFRVFQGIGFGAEWGVGAVLVAELVRPESRGQGARRHPERVGDGLGAGRHRVPDRVRAVPGGTAWRVLMCLGILPALLILYVRSRVEDPEVFTARRRSRERAAEGDPLGPAGEDDDRRVGARDRHPGRLLRDVHLDPDVPEDGARPDRRGHERVPVRGHRGRVPRLPDRGLRARPDRAPARVRAVRGAGGRVAGGVLRGPGGVEHDAADRRLPARVLRVRLLQRFGSYLAELFPTHARGPPAGAFVTTSAAASGRCSRASSASSRRRSGSAARSRSACSATCWRSARWRCCPRPRARTVISELLGARVYDLEQPRYAGLPIHPAHEPGVSLTLHRRHERGGAESRTGASALLVMAEHTGTHIDALCHQAYDGRLHGGVEVTPAVQTPTGFTALGIDTVAPIVRRGVLLDVAPCSAVGRRPSSRRATSSCGRATWCWSGSARARCAPIRRRYVAAGGVTADGSRWLAERRAVRGRRRQPRVGRRGRPRPGARVDPGPHDPDRPVRHPHHRVAVSGGARGGRRDASSASSACR